MKKRLSALFLIWSLASVAVFGVYSKAFAQTTMPPFGGQILFRIHCEFPIPGFLITVSGPVGGNFLFAPSVTKLFMNYNIFSTGNWVLGLHTGVPIGCGNYEDGWCWDQIPTKGIMTIVGTS